MLHVLDILAVREAMRLQPTARRRRICAMLAQDYTQGEIARALGCSRDAVRRKVRLIRRSFLLMGFYPPRRRRRGVARVVSSRQAAA